MDERPLYVVVTKDYEKMNEFYHENIYSNVCYLGYGDDIETVKEYISQFSNRKNIYYVKTRKFFISDLIENKDVHMGVICLCTDDIPITDNEMDFVTEMECGWEFSDITNLLGSVKREMKIFKHKRFKKLKSEIDKAIKFIINSGDGEDCDIYEYINEGEYYLSILKKHGLR